jgi:ABC-2 type transport system permease protein
MSRFLALLARELRAVVMSPIAYALLAAFLVLMGYSVTAFLLVTEVATLAPVFLQMSALLLLVVPIAAMRLVAGERKAGTLELLLTAPVREVQVVLAKFGAGMALVAAMLALSSCYAGVLALRARPDWGPIYTGYLGLLLFGGALVAVGLLVSSLTSSQVAAAAISLGIFSLIWTIDSLGSWLPAPVDALSASLSLRARVSPFVLGSVFLSDVGFFVSVILLALFLSVRALARR